MDCQAFVEQCLRDVDISLNLAGSNAWYRKMTWVGSPEECRQKFGNVPIGAFLFILASDGKEPAKYREDGIGNASHIGIRTGQRERLAALVRVGVFAAQQLFRSDEGVRKKAYVIQMLEEQGYRIDSEEIDAQIEAELMALKIASGWREYSEEV